MTSSPKRLKISLPIWKHQFWQLIWDLRIEATFRVASLCLHVVSSEEACPTPETLASRFGCFNRANTAYFSWKRFSISWKRREEHFVPLRSSCIMLTADSIREVRVRKSAARNWLLLCESAGCDIIRPQECIEKLVAPSTTEIRLKLIFLVSKKSSRHQTALLFALKVVSYFFLFLFFWCVTFARHSVIPTARRKFPTCGSSF
jgi:hypothetical protein